MNREIKFRGKMVPEQVWIYGTLLRIPAPLVCLEKKEEDKYYIQFADPNYIPDWNMPYRMVQGQVDNNTIGQFTGLHDKNNIKIYEGDIVKYENMTGKIMFLNGSFVMSDFEENEEWELGIINEEIEVVGNIYDNPELLEGE